MKNGSLSKLIKKEFSGIDHSDTIKMKILYGTAFGIQYLHHKNTVHRDIKPSNIFLDENYHPYIGDFGFAKIIGNNNKMTGDIGSLLYIDPDIIYKDQVDADFSVDIYSFAITVLETLVYKLSLIVDDVETLADLLDEETFVNLVQDGHRYVEIKKVPDDFKQFIEDCWSEDHQKRWKIDDVTKAMEEKRLFLKNTNSDEFFGYVNQLKEALERNENEEEMNEEEEEEEEEEEASTEEFLFQ